MTCIYTHTHPYTHSPTQDRAARGFRPCAYLGGPGDKLRLLGLKRGPGRRVFPAFDSFQRTVYEGGWRHGLRHGIGVLRYSREHVQVRFWAL